MIAGWGAARAHRRSLAAIAAAVGCALLALAACTSAAGTTPSRQVAPTTATPTATASAAASAADLQLTPATGAAAVAPELPVTAVATGGALTSVSLVGAQGDTVPGALSGDGTQWISTAPLRISSRYTLTATAVDAAHQSVTRQSSFTTLTPASTVVGTYSPDDGTTVGVAMPISITFNAPITDKAAVERRLAVTANPPVIGSWSWMKDRDGQDRVDYRPQSYWAPGTRITLDMGLDGVNTGSGVYGTQDRHVTFTIGRSVVSVVDVATKTMTVSEDGHPVRTIPISAGKPGFDTWNGTMVVLEKIPDVEMNSTTVGIFGTQGYDIKDVQYAVRLTVSGTFVHAAPWNTGKFGVVNGSHGCIGMSTDDAAWFFGQVEPGDPVQVIHSTATVPVNNGYGDWNPTWAQWTAGSALH